MLKVARKVNNCYSLSTLLSSPKFGFKSSKSGKAIGLCTQVQGKGANLATFQETLDSISVYEVTRSIKIWWIM